MMGMNLMTSKHSYAEPSLETFRTQLPHSCVQKSTSTITQDMDTTNLTLRNAMMPFKNGQ